MEVDATDAGHARPASLLRPSMPGDAEGIRAMPPEMPVRHSCKYTASRLASTTSARCNRTQRNKMQVASQVLKLSGQHSTCFHCETFAIKKVKIHTKVREEDGPRCTYLSLRPIADGAIYRYRVLPPRLPLSFDRIWSGF